MQTACITIALSRCAAAGPTGEQSSWRSLRDEVLALAAGVHFRRLLHRRGLPFRVFIPTPLLRSPHFMVSLGGRPCLLLEKPRHARPAAGADGLALPPGTLVVLFERRGGFRNTLAELREAARMGQNMDLYTPNGLPVRDGGTRLHLAGPANSAPVDLEAFGRSRDGSACQAAVTLRSGEAAVLPPQMARLIYLRSRSLPDGDIQLIRPGGQVGFRVRQTRWRNLWRHGAALRFAGFTTLVEYKSGCAPIAPIDRLLESIRYWHNRNSVGSIRIT